MQLQLKNHTNDTLVPGRFIDCCIGAPDKYTQAYLLFLKHSASGSAVDLELLCARLKMSMEEVLGAFEYWQKQGVARVVNGKTMCIEFGDFSMPAAASAEDDLYTEREFNQMLQNLFGSRQLSPHDYLKIYDYTDTFGLNKKVVLKLAEYCVLLKGRRVSIAYIDSVAKTWAEEKIDTEDKAQSFIEWQQMEASGVMDVLKQLSLSGRKPTKDEYALFKKWTREWGFTVEAILTACAQTTAAREPSFKYLDKILERLKNRGLITSRTIAESNTKNEQESAVLKEVMHLLGEPSGKPSFEHESLYQKWTTVYGFDKTMLILAAKHVGARGKRPFALLDNLLTDWYNNRIATAPEAKAYIAKLKELDERIMTVFEMAGIAKTPTDAHRKIYERWNSTWGIAHDAILLAADVSTLSDKPYSYLNSILTNWHNKGVKTLEDAQREMKRHGNESHTAVRESFERPVENYDHLAVNLFEDEGA